MPGRVDGFWGSGSRPLMSMVRMPQRLMMMSCYGRRLSCNNRRVASEGNVWGLKHASSMLKPVAISAKNMYQSLGIRVSLHVANEHVCEYRRINLI